MKYFIIHEINLVAIAMQTLKFNIKRLKGLSPWVDLRGTLPLLPTPSTLFCFPWTYETRCIEGGI